MFRLLFPMVLFVSATSLQADYGVIENRKSTGAIIIPDRPNAVEKTAAEELRYHLHEATGVELPVLPESRITAAVKGGFRLGRAAGENAGSEPGAYAIRLEGNFLNISGRDGDGREDNERTPAGTLFGVYHYLRHGLGIRWLWPGKTGEYIPRLPLVRLDNKLDGSYKPAFQFVRAANLLRDPEAFRWGRRVMNLEASQYPVHAGTGGHAFGKWAEQYGKGHPEWFALQKDGRRDVRSHAAMCISNAGFQEQIVKLWHQAQQKKPDSKLYINVKENDTQNRCTCEKCLSWDGPDKRGPTGRYDLYRNVGERYARFYHEVRQKAAELDPDARVSFYAYQSYFYAPRRTRLNANFYVGLVPDIPFPRRPAYDQWLREEYRAWQQSGATLYHRPNYFLGGYCMPEVWYDQYAGEFKFLNEIGCIGITVDGPGNMWATRGLDYYVMARLGVEPQAGPEQLAAEYYSGFAAAAPEIKAYFEFYRNYLRENTARINDIYEASKRKWYFHGFHYAAYAHEIFPVKVLAAGFPYLEKAAAKVRDDPAARVKVDFLRQGLEYAVASVQCAEVFADPKTTNGERRRAWDGLHEKRAGLPRHAVNTALLDRIEKNVWQVMKLEEGDNQALPEIWQVMPDPRNRGEKLGYPKTGFDASEWGKASTWKTLEQQNIDEYINMWYRLTIHIAEKSSEKVILRLGAVDESCEVWINGNNAGTFTYDAKKDPGSWEKPLEFDITDHVRFGADNIICVKVINLAGDGGLWKPSCLIYR